MTKEEILKGNKILADFMGVKPKMESPDVYYWSDTPFFSVRENNPEKVMRAIVEYSKYHTSWDWLMPVVMKIRGIYRKSIHDTMEKMSDRYGFCVDDGLWDMEELYNACVLWAEDYILESKIECPEIPVVDVTSLTKE
jgi:hypothetical protein